MEQGEGQTSLTWEVRSSSSSFSPENLEDLTEKVGNLALQVTSKNRSGAAKKRARKARIAETPSGNSGRGQPRLALGDQPQTLQKPGICGVQHGKTTESKGNPPGPSK